MTTTDDAVDAAIETSIREDRAVHVEFDDYVAEGLIAAADDSHEEYGTIYFWGVLANGDGWRVSMDTDENWSL